jgi:hypothetical protein
MWRRLKIAIINLIVLIVLLAADNQVPHLRWPERMVWPFVLALMRCLPINSINIMGFGKTGTRTNFCGETETTIAGRMEHYLNSSRQETKYTAINLGAGNYIACQEFITVELWGASLV